MAKLSKGTTFTDGISANAAALNNLVDQALILPGAITEQSSATPDVGDSLLIYDFSSSGLAKCTIQNVVDAFPADAAAGSKSLRTLGTLSTQAAPGNDTRFPASVTGIRKGAGAANADTAAAPKDLLFAPVNINALTNIDWDAADVFYDAALSGNKTYTFSNVRAGRVIVIQINQNGHTVAFPAGFLVLGTPNTASWNVYSIVSSAGASLVSCSS